MMPSNHKYHKICELISEEEFSSEPSIILFQIPLMISSGYEMKFSYGDLSDLSEIKSLPSSLELPLLTFPNCVI